MCTSFGCAISPRPADEFSVPSNISWSTEERAQGSRFEPRALSQSRHCSHRKDVAINARSTHDVIVHAARCLWKHALKDALRELPVPCCMTRILPVESKLSGVMSANRTYSTAPAQLSTKQESSVCGKAHWYSCPRLWWNRVPRLI